MMRLHWCLPPVVYSILALVMTWPLAGHLSTHIPGTGGDGPNFLWRLWWVPHALVSRAASPWHTDLLFHPQGVSLVFDTLAPLYGLLSYPIQVAGGVVTAYNLLLMGSLILAAWGCCLLAMHLTGDSRAALVAGTVFGFSPYLLVHLWGHLNLVAAWPLPFFALCFIRAVQTGGARWGFAAGALLGTASLLDYQYGVFALLWGTLAGVYWQIRLPRGRHARAAIPVSRYPWRAWCAGLAAWLAVFGPLLGPVMQAVAGGENPVAGNPTDPGYFSADLLGFFLPSAVRWGGSGPPLFESPNFQGVGGIEGTAYVGWVVLGLAGAAWLVRATPETARSAGPVGGEVVSSPPSSFGCGFWLVTLTVFALLSLGPQLRVAGSSLGLPLPYAILEQVPYVGSSRVPARFAALVYLALGVVVAFGFRRLVGLASFRRAGALKLTLVAALAMIAIAADYAVAPVPLRSVEVPAFYQALAQEPGEFGLMLLPMLLEAGPRGGSLGRGDQLLQYYQVVHGKPILYGHVARGSSDLLEFYQRWPVVRWLANPEASPPSPEDLDPAVFTRTMRDLNLRYAVLHKDYYNQVSLLMLREYFEQVFRQRVVWDDDAVLAFRLEPAGPADPLVVAEFHRHYRPKVSLLQPPDGAQTLERFPLLLWEPQGTPGPLFEIQVSRDPWFGRTFLYHESIDGRLTNPPFSYRIPERYPLAPGTVYYWRVRRAGEEKPLPWTPAWRFVSP